MGSLIKELLRLVRSKMASAEGRCCCRREWTASASLHLTPSEAVCLSLCSYRAIQHRFRVSNFAQTRRMSAPRLTHTGAVGSKPRPQIGAYRSLRSSIWELWCIGLLYYAAATNSAA